jgi:hypothetical protein
VNPSEQVSPWKRRGFHDGVRLSFFALTFVLSFSIARLARGANSPDYERDIKPILLQRCYPCHSRLKQKSGLRLDAGALIHKGGKHGAAIVAGRSAESPLIQRVLSTNEDEQMPPEGKPLLPDQITLLQRWIDSGARYPKDEVVPQTEAEHWAFQPIRQPPLPTVKNKRWARNAIDLFVCAKLEQRGLPNSVAPSRRDEATLHAPRQWPGGYARALRPPSCRRRSSAIRRK